jgi:4-amino-4-deoxy-L-arabinose transferase-like glycosyltransferase
MSYYATTTLFDGPLHINQELRNVYVTPSVDLWCYPPGLYTLLNITYSIFGVKITNINIVLLILQILAVVLAFFTFKKILNAFASFVLSLFVLAFVTKVVILADFSLLPFLILVFTILFYSYRQFAAKPTPLVLVSLGALVGLITYIKHNTGILLFVALSSYIFFSALQFEAKEKHESKTGLILVWIIIIIHLIFGLVFLFQMRSITTSLYYLLPFGMFFLSLIYYIFFKNKNVYLKTGVFLRNYAIFAAPFVVIVAAWLIWFGTTVGFSRYINSLYGMYSGFTGTWDVGIGGLFTRNINFQGFNNLSSIGNTIYSLFYACLIFVPFIAAFISAATMSFHLVKNNPEKIKQYAGICILGIMGIFFLYPTESGHNITIRIFLFVFILFFFYSKTKLFTKRNVLILFTVLLIFIIPLFYNNISDGISAAGGEYTRISEKVDVKVPNKLAKEINRATDLINATTEKNKYYVIDSYSMLYIYYYLTDVSQKNYFTVMIPGILDKKVTTEIVKTVADYQYLVVNKEQYDMFISGVSYNPDLDELFNYIKENYEIINTFIKNLERDDAQFINFYIMKLKAQQLIT